MATNFSIADGVKVIAENQNQEQLEEFGKRFPRIAIMISKCVAKAGDDFVELMRAALAVSSPTASLMAFVSAVSFSGVPVP